jgi:hypothetical protein
MKNLEKRYTTGSQLAAYLKTKDDLYFSAIVSAIIQKIRPGGNTVLAVWSELPQDIAAADLDLMIGLAVSMGSETAG